MKVRLDTPGANGRSLRRFVLGGVLVLGALLASRLADGALANPCPDVSCGNTVTIIPGAAEYMSLVLDAEGKPVISYGVPGSNSALGLLHCGDEACATGNVTSSPDTSGQYTSLRLDAAGHPVISYYYGPTSDLRVLHCNDANCSGGDESIASPDTDGDVGRYSSLALDASGRPVVGYLDTTNGDLKVLHCGDPNCLSGNVVSAPDTPGFVGSWASLALDAAGNPVVGYQDEGSNDVKLLHCDDPNCSGAGESIARPDSEGSVGPYLSLKLDAAGHPVMSYRDVSHFDLRLLHCGDGNCTSGNALTSPDTGGAVGSFSSLTIDGAGNPVMSYWDASQSRLKVLHCGDPACGANNAVAAPDDDLASTAPIGQFTSITLDASGVPVVAYARSTGVGLGVLHCADVNCGANDFDGDGCQDAQEEMTANGTEFGGGRRDPKDPWDYFNPTGDGMNRIDDVLAVVDQYLVNEFLPSPPNPPNTPNPAYTSRTDRTYSGPNLWNLGLPNGRQNVDDIVAALNSFMHDCF
jgi:hypothetical protein